MRIKDESGNIVPGMIKNSIGGIVVDNLTEYNRHKKQTELALEMQNLKTDMTEIKDMLKLLLLNKSKE